MITALMVILFIAVIFFGIVIFALLKETTKHLRPKSHVFTKHSSSMRHIK